MNIVKSGTPPTWQMWANKPPMMIDLGDANIEDYDIESISPELLAKHGITKEDA